MRRWILTAILGFLVVAMPALAQQKVYDISNYDVDVVLRTDGSYRVTEHITFDFQQGAFTFATRNIPLTHIDSIEDISVHSDDVRLRNVTRDVRSGEHIIRWEFPERTGPTTFTLSYAAHGALFAADGLNKIDWDAVGTGWSVPVHDVDVQVVVPAAFDLTATDIQIQPRDEGRLTETSEGWVAKFSYPRLSPGTAYRVIVSFPRQLAGRPPGSARSGSGIEWELIVAAITAGLLGTVPGVVAFFRWRGPSFESTNIEEPGIPLPRAAVLLNGATSGGQRAFPAVVFDLAARGHLTLRRVEHKRWIFSQKKIEIEFHEDPADLNDFEQDLIDELKPHDTLEQFGSRARSYRKDKLNEVQGALIEEGYLVKHRSRSTRLFGAGFLFDAVAILLGVVVGGWMWVVAGLLFGLSIGAFFAGARMHTPTEKGARLKAEIEAYLDQTREKIERLRQYDPTEAARTFIRQLPWLALDSDVDQRWVKKLADALKEAREDLEAPPWAEDLTGETVEAASQAYVAFMPYYHVTTAAAAAAAPSSGAAGAGAGAGAGGGAGGGGGGAG